MTCCSLHTETLYIEETALVLIKEGNCPDLVGIVLLDTQKVILEVVVQIEVRQVEITVLQYYQNR